MRLTVSIVIALAANLAASGGRAAAPPTPARVYTFGVVPQQSPAQLARAWTPILNAISARSGYRLLFRTAKDIPTFERRLARGEYDFAYMNPYHYTVFARSPGYRVFANQKHVTLVGIVVVRNGSGYHDISQLQGKTIAFPAPASFAATVLPLAHLERVGIVVRPTYVGSHDSVYMSVAQGLFPAGGGIERTFETLPPSVRDQLRILWRTPPHTPHAFAAAPAVPPAAVKRVAQAMFALGDDARGREVLRAIGFKGIEPAKDSDYDDIRALHIEVLTQPKAPVRR